MHMTHSIKSSVFTRSRLDICNCEIQETVASLLYLQLFKLILLFQLWKNYKLSKDKCIVFILMLAWIKQVEYCWHYPEKELKHCLSFLNMFFPSLAKYATSKETHTFSNRTAWHFTFLKIYDLQSGWMTYFSYNVIFWNMSSFSLSSFDCPLKQEEN